MDDKKDIERYLEDAMMGRPYAFTVNGRHFYLHPVTYGKMLLLQRMVEQLGINQKNILMSAPLEALRIAREKKEECLAIIYYNTCRTKEEVFDVELMEERVSFFRKHLTDDDIASMVIMILTFDKTQQFFKHLGIDKEQHRLETVMRLKNKKDKNNISFGCKSQFGALLDAACERYKWTKDYVMWEIDYSSLRLMLADKANSVYVTDEEWRKLPLSVKKPVSGEERINGDDRKAIREAIKSQKWD